MARFTYCNQGIWSIFFFYFLHKEMGSSLCTFIAVTLRYQALMVVNPWVGEGRGCEATIKTYSVKKDAPHPQHFVSLRIISFWINRDCTLSEVQLSLSAMLKGGYKAIDFSEDNIFLLFNLRFRGYETHHKTPLLIYL